jgi:leucyl aminopeptidase
MLDMKCDMSGAAGMIGVAMYLDTLPILPVNLIIGVGLTENMT